MLGPAARRVEARVKGPLLNWILGLLGAAILGGAGAVISQGQKVAVLENDSKSVHDGLDRIEKKLDRLLEGRTP